MSIGKKAILIKSFILIMFVAILGTVTLIPEEETLNNSQNKETINKKDTDIDSSSNTSAANKIENKKRIKVVLDAGHGGEDVGAFPENSQVSESEININITLKLKEQLELHGYDVVLTRTTDEFLSLEERSAISNKENADLFISIHQNSFGDSNINGVSTYYNSIRSDADFANSLQTSLVNNTNANNRGIIGEEPLSVLFYTEANSVLLETGFITNPEESLMLASDEYQEKISVSIVSGINEYHNFNC